jgi:hypothetical protein
VCSINKPNSRISDDARAFELTKHDSFAKLWKRLPADESKPYTIPKHNQEQVVAGPQVIRMCTWQMMQWNLLTHAGFVTFPHKDANGLCTWIYSHTGVKIWAIIEPKCTTQHNTRNKLNELHRRICYSETEQLAENADIFTTFLSPGDILQVFMILTPL